MEITGLQKRKTNNSIQKRKSRIFFFLFFLTALMFVLDIIFGSVTIPFHDILNSLFANDNSNINTIIVKFRIPKAFTAILVGAALSVSGLQMQTVFRNPMAGPYVLGISAGASLGVAFVILGFSSWLEPSTVKSLGPWLIAAASWIGAGLVLIIILYIAVRIKDILTVLIIGIMLSSGISAIVSIMQYFSHETMLKSYVIWTMGNLGNVTSDQLFVMAICIIAGLLLSFISVKMLNLLLLGEKYAHTLGLNLKAARALIFTSTSLLAGTVTAFCGPIGFIGIAVPHIARILLKTSDHRKLIPATMLIGSAVLLFSDLVSQLPGSDKVLPLNAVTSLIGIPVVIWIILRDRKYQETI
ncbi:MAG: iron ABC transporter permease [Bacteroidales bacterium]|mgnify:CR=1 FL=1|nr:iron ABC transporter permease [Bacteroidales bacterium]